MKVLSDWSKHLYNASDQWSEDNMKYVLGGDIIICKNQYKCYRWIILSEYDLLYWGM